MDSFENPDPSFFSKQIKQAQGDFIERMTKEQEIEFYRYMSKRLKIE